MIYEFNIMKTLLIPRKILRNKNDDETPKNNYEPFFDFQSFRFRGKLCNKTFPQKS